jgi:hypothetical protein
MTGRAARRASYFSRRRQTSHVHGYRPSRVAKDVINARSSFMQNGREGPNDHWATHRPQIRRRSAFGVITANSGSHPQNGQ